MKSVNELSNLGFDSLSEAMRSRLEKYFAMHEGVDIPSGLYNIIMKEIEKSIIDVTMKYAAGNQVKAAKILGINRNTLHKKLIALDLNDEC